MSSIVTQGQSRKQTDLIAFLCPRQELNLRPAGLQPAALTKLSYRGETCAPTRIRAGGRRARSSGGGNRTRDPELMKLTLYRLSYVRIRAANSARTRYVTLPVFTFVPATGLEPTTSTVSEWRSHQLNYAGKDENKVTKERPTPREHYMCFGAGGKRTSRATKGGNKTRDARPLNAFCFRQ